MKKLRLFNVRKPQTFKTPNAPHALEAYASKAMIEDVIRCPTCNHVYADADGFHDPCEHLLSHFGPFGWELPPHPATECLKGAAAFRVIETLALQGHDVTKVVSGELQDSDWLVWRKPSVPSTMVA